MPKESPCCARWLGGDGGFVRRRDGRRTVDGRDKMVEVVVKGEGGEDARRRVPLFESKQVVRVVRELFEMR